METITEAKRYTSDSVVIKVGRIEITHEAATPSIGYGTVLKIDGQPVENVVSIKIDIQPTEIIVATLQLLA